MMEDPYQEDRQLVTTTENTETVNAFNNSGLFSNHYLENMIQKVPEWDDDAHLRGAYSQIKVIFDRKGKNFEKYVEADLEHNWIRPVFDILGHHYGVQEGLHHDPLKPDYAFFPDQETLEEAYSHKKGAEDFYKKAIAVGDAKAWNVLLDKGRQGKAHREMTNPSYQIDVYLRATPPKWAILTNGRLWRLYHEDTSFKMDCYYEVNLPVLINRIEETGDITLFKYFYLFFRLEAFPQVPLGSSFLDRISEESTAYAQKIGNDLQENVYKAMKVLAEGFFADQSNSLSYSMEDIRDVQENSLRLLYRLLFIFYAESRKLLNTDNKHYREMSLRKLKEEIADRIDQGETMLAVRSTYWEGLKDLFRLINDGSEAFGYSGEEFYIPAYNGGLFDQTKNPFLAGKKIGNSYLAEAIDLLARSKGEKGSEKGMVYVDYSSLEIRHLGSIYEGILEYKLHLADEPMVAIKEKGKEVWLPKQEAANKKFSDSVEPGRLYLVTDKGERKATGSFYTPEYIVKYIVKNTLAPLIDPMMEEAMWAEELRKDLLKKLLSLKVLDPAMGSGHFLVEATDYIAREIIHAKEIARREDLDSDEVAENDIHWARREVVRNCIYGVDLNPMAVELAKLSLWLTTVAANKPLSFLDHHLRCGNSLIGAELGKLMILPNSKRDPGQLPMWQFVLKQQKEHTEDLLKRYAEMAAQPDDDLKTVKEKEKKFEELREEELSRRLNDLADIWLSTFFGNEVDEEEYQELQNYLSPRRFLDWSEFRTKEWFARAKMLASEKRFFHWELEFPEAFSMGGFDAIIGNPPYIRMENFKEIKNYLKADYISHDERSDSYVYFIENAHKHLSKQGRLGMIVSNKFLRSNYGKHIRDFLQQNAKIDRVVDFAGLAVFPTATVRTIVLLTSHGQPNGPIFYSAPMSAENFASLLNGSLTIDDAIEETTYEVDRSALSQPTWSFARKEEDRLISKLQSTCIPLINYCDGLIGMGIKSGLTEAFVIDKEQRSALIEANPEAAEIIKPFLNGRNVQRYYIKSEGLYLIYTYHGIDMKPYPAIIDHLKPYETQLRSRATKQEWYELQQPQYNYKKYLDNMKIIFPDIAIAPRFALDEEGYYGANTVYFIPLHDLYLLGLLNSKLGYLYFRTICAGLEGKGEIYLRFFGQYLEGFPVRFIDSSVSDEVEFRDGIISMTEQMLDLHKLMQSEIQGVEGFLTWLEGEIGSRITNLSGATKLQEYYNLDFAEFHAILVNNKKKLKEGYNPSARETKGLLSKEFQSSVSRIKAMAVKIEETDKLIDAMVYKLYDLTEEEIKIVEGSVDGQ
jgi:type I restriction-modification system DNA methylase subunit